jgi:hypothetical protein
MWLKNINLTVITWLSGYAGFEGFKFALMNKRLAVAELDPSPSDAELRIDCVLFCILKGNCHKS